MGCAASISPTIPNSASSTAAAADRVTFDRSPPGTSFTPFRRLATELRLEIWRHAHPGPRVIALEYNMRIKHVVSRQRCPAILHACSESREVALEFFQIAFDPKSEVPAEPFSYVYVDYLVDTLYIPPPGHNSETERVGQVDVLIESIAGTTLQPLRQLSIDLDVAGHILHWYRHLFQKFWEYFPSLEKFILVLDKYPFMSNQTIQSYEDLDLSSSSESDAGNALVSATFESWVRSYTLQELVDLRGQIKESFEYEIKRPLPGQDTWRTPKVKFKILKAD